MRELFCCHVFICLLVADYGFVRRFSVKGFGTWKQKKGMVKVLFMMLMLVFYRGGLFNFAQSSIPLLLESVDDAPHPPTLIVTGATASLKGSARFATFAAGKFAKRAIAQSLAREFGPKVMNALLEFTPFLSISGLYSS